MSSWFSPLTICVIAATAASQDAGIARTGSCTSTAKNWIPIQNSAVLAGVSGGVGLQARVHQRRYTARADAFNAVRTAFAGAENR